MKFEMSRNSKLIQDDDDGNDGHLVVSFSQIDWSVDERKADNL